MGWEPLPEGMGALPLVERLKAMNVEILDRLYVANVEIGQSFDAGGHHLTGLAPGVEDTDAVTVGQLSGADPPGYLPLSGGTINGEVHINYSSAYALRFRRPDTASSEWVLGSNTSKQLAFRHNTHPVLLLTEVEVQSYLPLNMRTHRIHGLQAGASSTDAANVGQLSLLEARVKELEKKVNEK